MRSSKKSLLILGCVLLVLLLALAVGCGGKNNNNDGNNNEAGNGELEPQYGGKLVMLQPSGPISMSWFPDMGPGDYAFAMPGAEPLLAVANDRSLEGILATDWEEDIEAKTITFKLREGVKFHDGTDFNADSVVWRFDVAADFSYIPKENQEVNYVEKLDDYTVRFHLNWWTNQMLETIGIAQMYSRAAFEAHGGLEDNAGIDWMKENLVGTGPFKLQTFERDARLVWVKNEDYWREGRPYLDSIEILVIPDASTASQKMEAREAHLWTGADGAQTQKLENLGFARQTGWAGIQTILVPNSVDEESPFTDLRLREALEYAINKDEICATLGFGYLEPLFTIAPQDDVGGDKVFREYNPDKAKQLLAEAGYPNGGLKVKLLAQVATGGKNDLAEMLKVYLDKVGFEVELDMVDSVAAAAAMYGQGWDHLCIGIGGQDAEFLTSIQRWYGHNTATFIYPSMKRPDEFMEMSRQSVYIPNDQPEAKRKATEEMVHYIAENALIIPIYNSRTSFIHDGTVHTDYLQQGLTRWNYYDMWIEQK